MELKEEKGRGEGAPEFEGHMDFVFFFGDNLGSSSHASEMMAGIAVVLFDGDGVFFTDDVSLGRRKLRGRHPSCRYRRCSPSGV